MVGNEGLVGVALCLGSDRANRRASVLSAGFAYRLSTHQAREEFCVHGELQALALRYTQCLIAQMAQSVACNRFHSIEQQLCRLLLLSEDRRKSRQLTMTHELMANMLGVRRESISESAARLHQLGVLDYSRGQITVLDHRRLLALSCECYAAVKKEAERLLPTGVQIHREHEYGEHQVSGSLPNPQSASGRYHSPEHGRPFGTQHREFAMHGLDHR